VTACASQAYGRSSLAFNELSLRMPGLTTRGSRWRSDRSLVSGIAAHGASVAARAMTWAKVAGGGGR
jgi:hypothetical protein